MVNFFYSQHKDEYTLEKYNNILFIKKKQKECEKAVLDFRFATIVSSIYV
jgi:hypothetical protein